MVALVGSDFLRLSLSSIRLATCDGTDGVIFIILPEGMNFFAASVRVCVKNFSPFNGHVGISEFANFSSVNFVKLDQSALL